MQFISDAELAGQLLAASEHNAKISRHIQAARVYIIVMAAALLLLASVNVSIMPREYAGVAIAAYALGYATRAIVGHMRRARRRR